MTNDQTNATARHMTSAAARTKAALFQAFKTTTPNKIHDTGQRGQATGATSPPKGGNWRIRFGRSRVGSK